MKTITEIAQRLVELIRDKKFLEAQEELFDEDCQMKNQKKQRAVR